MGAIGKGCCMPVIYFAMLVIHLESHLMYVVYACMWYVYMIHVHAPCSCIMYITMYTYHIYQM